MTGYLWGENIGWIKLNAHDEGPFSNKAQDDWGVNVSKGGRLHGFAWGENVGWIRFNRVGVDFRKGKFIGYAWGENIGWVRLRKHTFMNGMGTDVFMKSLAGIPKWWLDFHNISETYDDGDNVSIVAEYIMGSNPNDPDSAMEIAETSIVGNQIRFTVTPTYTNRLYSLVYKQNANQENWDPVPGQTGIRGSGETHTLETELTGGQSIYSVKVQLLE